jgi:hypothetical protein
MKMKHLLLSILVAFFATLSPSVAQTQQLITANGQKINRIIDDYVIGLVRNITCRPEERIIRVKPLADVRFLVMVHNPLLREPSIMELSFNTLEQAWDLRTDNKLTYNTGTKFKFLAGTTAIAQPEIDKSNVLTLTGSNNTLMRFVMISSSHIDIDPCAFVSISPNPVYDETNIIIESESPRNAKLMVYDNFGNLKQLIPSIPLIAGKNTKTISLRNNPPGLYRVIVEADEKRQIVPIQKW